MYDAIANDQNHSQLVHPKPPADLSLPLFSVELSHVLLKLLFGSGDPVSCYYRFWSMPLSF